ncbi:hypothetical protein MRB53_032677 [Persea americana]|uniref:Uncharacterized protein n=1 Tax=Persea americana TaxID=3435 RepID=A0ACC2KSK9_PERAE|nr:hypothetical protein MRB53_032677 [Persea americana]
MCTVKFGYFFPGVGRSLLSLCLGVRLSLSSAQMASSPSPAFRVNGGAASMGSVNGDDGGGCLRVEKMSCNGWA